MLDIRPHFSADDTADNLHLRQILRRQCKSTRASARAIYGGQLKTVNNRILLAGGNGNWNLLIWRVSGENGANHYAARAAVDGEISMTSRAACLARRARVRRRRTESRRADSIRFGQEFLKTENGENGGDCYRR